ncbi:hypothetical protein JCM8547_005473 [Rhodosporidiobolus lusitaniae]
MAPTPRRSTPSKAANKRRCSSLPTPRTASPLASTSRDTLDSPASSIASAKKGKRRSLAQAASEEAAVDERFAAFLDEEGGQGGKEAAVEKDGGESAKEEEEEEDFGGIEEAGIDDGEVVEEDDRFASFPPEDGADGEDVELTEQELLARTTLPAHLLPRSAVATKNGKKAKTPGLIYLSRIPPGMGPGKVKHLLSQFGEVGRIYLARADAGKEISAAKRFKQKERHQSHNFKEGWVEYLDKRVARSVAEMLNAQTIGGKKSDRWHDDIWTMRYLPRFRWDQLSEQVALERATQTSLLRFHLTHSKAEQESYLSAVERAKTARQIEDKAVSRGKTPKSKVAAVGGTGGEAGEKGGKKREYRQREVVDVSRKKARTDGGDGGGKALESVLGRLF